MLNRRQKKAFVRSPHLPVRAAHTRPADTHVQRNPATRSRRSSLWYALYFPALPDAPPAEVPAISVVAQQCQHITDYVSIDGDDAVVLEVGRSLRYFGGLARIRQRIEADVATQLPHRDFLQAVAPSASASLLLARTGQQSAIINPQDLRSSLGGITTSALAIDIRIRRKLAKCGLIHLRDIWRLPSAELRIRFGRQFSDHIEHCLGSRPEVRPRWQAPPHYHDRYDADHGLHRVPQIVTACEQLLHRLETFLRQHHLCTDQLVFVLAYDNSAAATDNEPHQQETVTVNVRKAERAARLFLLLLETQLAGMTFAGEIVSITLRVSQFAHFKPNGGVQQKTGATDNTHGSPLLDTLAARLGSHAVQRLCLQADYCPESATRMVPYLTPMPEDNDNSWHNSHNPCWLLQPPRPLVIRNQQLYYLSPLTLLRGPRRIETRWWQQQGIRRDYYVAANAQGNLLWIFQDLTRSTQNQQRQAAWYLHGFFG